MSPKPSSRSRRVALTFRPVGAQIEDTLEKHFIAAQQAMEARLAKVTLKQVIHDLQANAT
jgi:hypothetical protein